MTDSQTYTDATKTDNAAQWQVAIDTELEALRDNRTWITVPRPPGVKPLHAKWVFKPKTNADGSIERYKARLVACGNEQEKGVNYENTFAPVLDMATARWILAMGVLWGVPPRHGDIPNAYVRAQGEKDFKIFMYVPKGMKLNEEERANGEDAVLQLLMSLYGLKQAGRLWNALLHGQMLKNGYKQCKTDLCLYYKRIKEDLIIVGVYVDDLLTTATKPALVDDFFEELKELKVKDLGVVSKFLGMRVIYPTIDGYTLDHTAMIRDMVERYDMKNSKPIGSPIAEHENEDREGQELLDQTMAKRFRSLAGALLWIARCTRPDIGYAVHRMTRRTHAPRIQDWKLGKRILRYLNGTADFKLHFIRIGEDRNLKFVAYSDADFAADLEDRKSISASMIFVNGLLMTWVVSKQANVTLSTMESEFVAAARAVQELLGLLELVREVG